MRFISTSEEMEFKKWIALMFFSAYAAMSATESPLSKGKPNKKISNGWITNIRQAPHTALRLKVEYKWFTNERVITRCGANIINNQWLLTAGHCVKDSLKEIPVPMFLAMDIDDIRDRDNMPQRNDSFPEGLPQVDLHVCHPDYMPMHIKRGILDHFFHINDICLLRVDHEIQFGPFINRVTLPWTAYDTNIMEKVFTVSGFGSTEYDDLVPLPDELFSTMFKLVPHEECEKKFGLQYYRGRTLCSSPGYKATSSVCPGDSGSGLVYRDNITNCLILVGITVSGQTLRCETPNTSALFESVLAYRKWIEETIGRYSRPAGHGSVKTYKYPSRNTESAEL